MVPGIQLTVGALLLGTLVTAVGFGITTAQTYLYMKSFPGDPKIIRWTVWSLLALDTTHVALSWHMIYYYVILNYNNPPALADAVWSFDTTIVITAVITVIVHCFYARRILILGQHIWQWTIVVVVLILSALRLIFGCIATERIFAIKVLARIPYEMGAEVAIGIGAGTLADCIITASLVFYLRRQRSGFNSRTDSLLDRIVFWTVNNGMLTSIVGIVVVVTLLSMPDNMIYLSVHLLLSKLYANALLATLNFRRAHRGRGLDAEETPALPLSALHATTLDAKAGERTAVRVTTTTISDLRLPFGDKSRTDRSFAVLDEEADSVTAPAEHDSDSGGAV